MKRPQRLDLTLGLVVTRGPLSSRLTCASLSATQPCRKHTADQARPEQNVLSVLDRPGLADGITSAAAFYAGLPEGHQVPDAVKRNEAGIRSYSPDQKQRSGRRALTRSLQIYTLPADLYHLR